MGSAFSRRDSRISGAPAPPPNGQLCQSTPREFVNSVVARVFLFLWRPKAKPLPGGLEPEGAFEAEVDLDDPAVAAERQRDFARIVAGGALLDSDGGARPAALDLAPGPCATFAECAARLEASGAFGGDLSALLEGPYALASATTPFEWAGFYGITPHFGEAKYVIIRGGRGPRVAWAALLGDADTRRTGHWPFFVVLVSEPLPGAGTKTRFRYTCRATAPTDGLPGLLGAWFDARGRGLLEDVTEL